MGDYGHTPYLQLTAGRRGLCHVVPCILEWPRMGGQSRGRLRWVRNRRNELHHADPGNLLIPCGCANTYWGRTVARGGDRARTVSPKPLLQTLEQNAPKMGFGSHIKRRFGTVRSMHPIRDRGSVTYTTEKVKVARGRASDRWRAPMGAIGQNSQSGLTFRERMENGGCRSTEWVWSHSHQHT